MTILVIGDLHLGKDGQRLKIPSEWSAYDAVFLVGDVVDAGSRTPSIPNAVYSELTGLGSPVFSVPGNHDFRTHASRVAGYEEIISIHTRQVDMLGHAIGGLGSTRFDEGPEIRGNLLQELSTESLLDAIAIRAKLSKSDKKSSIANSITEQEYKWYQERLSSLRDLGLQSSDLPQILVTHIPPFGSSGSYLESHPRGSGKVSWGSLAVRRYLEEMNIELHLCGHIHEQSGADMIADTVSLNAGYRNAFEINLPVQNMTDISTVGLEWIPHDA